jgi:hypothetical protein
MVTPQVTEILSAHRRQLELVRRSLVAVPEPSRTDGKADPRNPLHQITPRRAAIRYDQTW